MLTSETVMDRLARLHPRLIDLSLGRIERLLASLGHPERRLPPVLHVAGTNGKGSTCAFLRSIAEAAGQRVHVYTSPHLVSFHERIRLAGNLVTEPALLDALARCEAANAEQPITVFEIATAAAFLLFSEVEADLLVLEVGLGGRYDATNVVDRVTCAAITSISFDHREFLGDTLEAIAFEKAGIVKRGAPVVTGRQKPEVLGVIERIAGESGTKLLARDRDWSIRPDGAGLVFEDRAGTLALPAPSLPGAHQADNAGIAVATWRAAALATGDAEPIQRGIASAQWPARLQRLRRGPLPASLPPGFELWLDGGHNPDAGQVLAAHLAGPWSDLPTHLVVGMKASKDVVEFLRPLVPVAASLVAVAEPEQHLAYPPEAILEAASRAGAGPGFARIGPLLEDALRWIPTSQTPHGRVLICGSLYLAGVVLRSNG